MSIQQLQHTIDKQAKKLEKYENKLRDIISAYKSLLVEKEALETSLQAVSTTDKSDLSDKEKNDAEPSAIEKLQKSINTLTQESNKRELAYTEEKKKLLDDNKEFRTQLRELKREYERQRQLFEQHLSEAQASLRSKQCAHDVEKKELHAKLASYITIANEAEKKSTAATVHLQCENKQQTLLNEIDLIKKDLESIKTEKKSQAQDHQMEIYDLIAKHERMLDFERQKSFQLERKIANISSSSISNDLTEQRCQQLVDSIALLQIDARKNQYTVESLQTRINDLEVENTELRNQLKELTKKRDLAEICSTKEECLSTIQQFYDVLLNKHNISSKTIAQSLGINTTQNHDHCEQVIAELKERLQTIRAQSTDSAQPKNMANLYEKLTKTEEERANLKKQIDLFKIKFNEQLAKMKNDKEAEIITLKENFDESTRELQLELTSQRERSVHIINEMQEELDTARSIMSHVRRGADLALFDGATTENSPPTDPKMCKDSPGPVSRHASAQDSLTHFSNINYYEASELTRKEREVTSLRRELRSSEGALRDAQHELVTTQLQQHETVSRLQEEIRSLEGRLNTGNATANSMQYLRNVLLQYLRCPDHKGRQSMVKAMGKVLQFTKEDMKAVEQAHVAMETTKTPYAFQLFGSAKR